MMRNGDSRLIGTSALTGMGPGEPLPGPIKLDKSSDIVFEKEY